jgi:hypothetical protein
MRRAVAWLVVLPFAAASVLLGHWIAYGVVGDPSDDLHGYLAHAPQVVLVLATLALLGLATDARVRRRSMAPLAGLATVAFVVQEHLERLIHTGELPFLLTSPVLWLGIVLQIPIGLAIWWLARRVAEDLATSARRNVPRLSAFAVPLVPPAAKRIAAPACESRSGRGPPVIS